MSTRQHDRALLGMRRALELNPNDADVLTDMGSFCSYAGKPEEGLVYALKGMKINPHYPEYYADQLGQIYFDARQYENAIRTFEGIRNIRTPSMLVYSAASHAALGHNEAAHALPAKLLASEPQSTATYWANQIPYSEDRDREHMAANFVWQGCRNDRYRLLPANASQWIKRTNSKKSDTWSVAGPKLTKSSSS